MVAIVKKEEHWKLLYAESSRILVDLGPIRQLLLELEDPVILSWSLIQIVTKPTYLQKLNGI